LKFKLVVKQDPVNIGFWASGGDALPAEKSRGNGRRQSTVADIRATEFTARKLSNAAKYVVVVVSILPQVCRGEIRIISSFVSLVMLRDKQGWSQADLASKSGVSQVMIGKYERGEAAPSIDAAKKIADAFEVSLDHLVSEGMLKGFDKKHYSGSTTSSSSKKIKRKHSWISSIPTSATLKAAKLRLLEIHKFSFLNR
jgi:transcriptional regulator with XRE-family HTH domain